MLTYTVSSSQLAEADIYEIREVSSLEEFLTPGNSLCIVKAPFEGTRPEMIRIEGKNQSGGSVCVYAGICSGNDQGYLKCKLDKTLRSAYLFISWKQRGCHTFKMVKERQTVADFPDFQSALEACFPDGFIPEKSYRRNQTVFSLMCKTLRRRALITEVDAILRHRITKLLQE